MAHVGARKGLVLLIALFCLIPGRPPTEASSVPAFWQAGCGQSMDALNRLQADLGLDRALADRINSLAEASRGSGQAPPTNELESVTEDGLDGLSDAGDQLEQVADDIGRQLEEMNLSRQHAAWSRGVARVRTARSNLRYVSRPGSIGAGRPSGSTSATGVGPQWIAEAAGAAGDVGTAAENLNRIALDGQFNDVARSPGLQQGAADSNPPANPGPDRWQEALKRMQAQQARIRNNVKGLNAARSLQARQFQQAQQNTNDMQQAMQQAQGLADQLGQLAALCNQAMQQQQQQQQQQSQSTQSQPAQAAATSGGGGMGAGMIGLAAAGAAAGGYLLYEAAAASCGQPPDPSQGCLNGSCSACAAWFDVVLPYCDCEEEKHPEAAGLGGLCRQARDLARQAAQYCLAPPQSTPIPKSAFRR